MVEGIYDQEHQKFSSELAKQAASLTPRIQVCWAWVVCVSRTARDHLALGGDASIGPGERNGGRHSARWGSPNLPTQRRVKYYEDMLSIVHVVCFECI